MAPSSKAKQPPKPEETPLELDTDLGEDWEAAFQAEDYMFSPEEGEQNEFFHTSGQSGYDFSPPAEGDLSGIPDLDPVMPESAPPVGDAPSPDGSASAIGLLQRLAKLHRSFRSLAWPYRIGIGFAVLLTLFSLLPLWWPHGAELHQDVVLPPEAKNPAPPSAEPLPVVPEKKESQWPFAPFLIPAASAGEQPVHFVRIELTLLLQLEENQDLPEADTLLLREAVYHFYRQQSLETLRRYALARAEMNRNLLAWLRQRWPDQPLQGVLFNRYQLL